MRRLRERRSLSRQEFADILAEAVGGTYQAETIRRWETGGRPLSKKVNAFIEELALQELSGLSGATPDGLEADDQPIGDGADGPTDTAPGGGAKPLAQLPVGGGPYATACEELWELIATGIGMIGAAVGSEPLMIDGQIILQDKKALGAAWGKLAQTNDTFRRMLVGMTEGGAWMQVILVTGTTTAKCWQVHQQHSYARRMQQQAAQQPASASENGFVDGPDAFDAAA